MKVNKLRYKQCGVTPYFSTGQNLWKKALRKDKILTQSIEKGFLIYPLNNSNAIYRDLLTLIKSIKTVKPNDLSIKLMRKLISSIFLVELLLLL